MKYLFSALPLLLSAILVSCNDKDSPEYPVFMQPSSFISQDSEGYDQTFEYDEYGRIVNWTHKSNNLDPDSRENDKADYSYPNDSTIVIKANYSYFDVDRYYEETIRLKNGRASKSDGIFIGGIRKTYSLEYEFDLQNHLTAVKHTELVGIGDEITNWSAQKPWVWEDYLIWENGNLKEFEDFYGKTYVYKTTKYEYFDSTSEYPVIVPMVTGLAHHLPLFMQGVFGSNSKNVYRSMSQTDCLGYIWDQQYTYTFEESRITEYTKTDSYNSEDSKTASYKVNWTQQFKPRD